MIHDKRIYSKGDLWPAPTGGTFPMTGKIPQTETVGNSAYYGKHRGKLITQYGSREEVGLYRNVGLLDHEWTIALADGF